MYVYVYIVVYLIYGKGLEGRVYEEESGWSVREGGKEMVKSSLFFMFLCFLYIYD